MSTSNPKDQSSSDGATDLPAYEQAVEELEAIIDNIESGSLPLDDSLKAYERGAELLARCRSVLDRAEQRIESIEGRVLGAESDRDSGGGGSPAR